MFKDKKIHFIGIGGISMSGIAEILHQKGAIITGSDMQMSKQVKKLIDKGIKIVIGEDDSLVNDVDIIIYTAAISEDNKELIKGKELNKEMMFVFMASVREWKFCPCFKALKRCIAVSVVFVIR